MQITSSIKIFLFNTLLCWAGTANGTITLDSVSTTESFCANNGSINIYAQSSSSLLYQIISGPEIRPAQSGNIFAALPQGAYQVMLTNFSNDTVISSATIAGTYVFPDFAPTFTNPTCPYSNTGKIICHPIPGTGRPPFTWVLTQVGTGLVTTQITSDTFVNLYANGGDYSIRMYDSCQAFATRYVTLTDPYNNFQLHYVFDDFISCDTNVVSLYLESNSGYWATPFVVSVFWGSNSKTDTINPVVYPGATVLVLPDTVGGMTYGGGGYVMVTDGCGQSVFHGNPIDPWNPQVTFGAVTDSCQIKFAVSFTLTDVFPPTTGFHAPIFFQLWDLTAGATVDSTQLNTSTAYYFPAYFLLPNHSYRFQVYDSCGNSAIRFFNTPIPDTASVTTYISSTSCLDSTAILDIHCINYTASTTTLTFLSGPTSAHSSKPYFTYRDTLIYPNSNISQGGCSATYGNDVCYNIGGLSEGTYTFRVSDSCGHSYTGSVTVRPIDLTIYDFKSTVIKGCPGQNKVNYKIGHSFYNYVQDFIRLYPINSTAAIDSIMSDSASFSNLNAGTYRIEHRVNRYTTYNLLSATGSCNFIIDTITIPPYQLPKIAYAIQIKCNGTVNVGLQPDSSFGVAPYDYEIISGPQTSSVQASNFFQLTQLGNYVVRISDVCGFARTFSFFVDTLSFQQIVKVGSSCLGNVATLICEHSPYVTYVWRKPNGSFYTGDTLKINPVTSANYGTYQVSKIVAVNGCTDTFHITYVLDSNGKSYQTASICAGGSFTFAGNMYTQAGIYFDTIPTAACDSIVQLNLTITPLIRDTFKYALCGGSPVTIGIKTYYTPGYYSDTSATSNCDSIAVYHITSQPTQTSTQSLLLCQGTAFYVGGITHYISDTSVHLVRDTITSSLGCDSIVITNLQWKISHVNLTTVYACTGDSITLIQNWVSFHLIDTIIITTSQVAFVLYDTTTTGCDSFEVVNILFGNQMSVQIYDTICAGQTFSFHGRVIDSTGWYSDTTARSVNCDSITFLHVFVKLASTTILNRSICVGQSFSFGGNSYNSNGVYRDTVTSASGCDSIVVLNLQVVTILRDTIQQTICTGQTFTTGTKTYSSTGAYLDSFSTSGGCDSIRLLNLLVVNILRDTISQTICAGQSITIGTKTYNSTGAYLDTFTTSGGCDSIRLLNLIVLPAKTDSVDFIFCEGENISINGQVYSQEGIYFDTLSTSSCDSVVVIHVSTFPKPSFVIEANAMEVEQGDTVQLNAVSNQPLTYFWTSIFSLNNNLIAQPVATIRNPGWLIAQATDSNNCRATDSIFIAVKDCAGNIFVPNAFTPNGDGNNDEFMVYGTCILFQRLMVFNRWGEKVFDSANINRGWNGYYKGELQMPGVFVYVVTFSGAHSGQTEMRKGSVALIR